MSKLIYIVMDIENKLPIAGFSTRESAEKFQDYMWHECEDPTDTNIIATIYKDI